MSDSPRITAARIEVARTRAALLETAHELQARLQPKTLASEAWEKAKDKGADIAEGAVDAVAKRPLAVGGAVAAIAMFLAREPLKAATVKFYDAMTPLFEPRTSKAEPRTSVAAGEKPAAPVPPAAPARPKAPARSRPRSTRRKTQSKTETA
ncbi:MAG: DUF3618 domain-containing protein [Sphingomonas sp.]|nr:DUF3618 domain-containing protein [Sphingomonas sp.]